MKEKKELHRVFIAIEFPEEVIKEVARVQEVLSGVKFIGKMTELENLHLTLKFLGEIDFDKLENVKKRLGEIIMKKFTVKLGEAGTFNLRGNPRIAWIKIEGKGLFELQKKIDESMVKEGFKREERFMSHMTIARVKYVKDKKSFVDYVKKMGVKSAEFEAENFNLKESELQRLGPVYKDLKVYRLN